MVMKHVDTETCSRCGSDLVLSRGPWRTALFEGVTLAVPAAMELLRCHGCRSVYPTLEQVTALRAVVERDTIGYDGRGIPVLRGT